MRTLSIVLMAMWLCASLAMPVAAQAPTATAAPAEAPRTWTTSEGRAFQATLVKLQGTQVTLRLSNGQMAAIALARLSGADQLYLRNTIVPVSGTPSTAGSAAVAQRSTRLPPEKRTWPARVEVDSRAIEVSLVNESAADQKYVYRSGSFKFISEDKLAGSVIKEIARTFEATRSLVQALPWGIEPKPPADLGYYQAKLYVTRDSYIADGAPANSGGVYFSKDRIFRVPFPSLGLEMRGKTWFKNEDYRSDAVVHEITHQMMHDFLPFLPIWVIEGTAEYTEMLPYNAGRFLSGSHERGFKDYLRKMQDRGIKPASIGKVTDHMAMTTEAWHQRTFSPGQEQPRLYAASCMLVYYFCHLDADLRGTRFFKYMEKIAEARDAWDAFFKSPNVKVSPDGSYTWRSGAPVPAQKRDEAYGFDQMSVLLDGRTPDQLQKEVVDGFKKIGIRW